MSPRRRTLCFFLILLSLNNGHNVVACFGVGPGLNMQPTFTEIIQTSESPIYPGNQRLGLNEAFKFGTYPQGLSINTISNYPAPRPFSAYSTYVSPTEVSGSLQTSQPITNQIESITVIDQNYPPFTQTVQVEGYAPTSNVAEVYQTPITVPLPSMPQLTPFATVASPLPAITSSQTIIEEVFTPSVVPEIVPQTVETEITTVTSVPVETPTLAVPACDSGYYGQQLPVTLQINMPSPYIPEPVITVISPPQPPPAPAPSPISASPYDYSSYGMPPVIVMENSRSKLNSIILPILMLSLLDGGSGCNGGGSCCSSQSSTSIPVPFPIVIPTSNPIVYSRGKGKSKGDN